MDTPAASVPRGPAGAAGCAAFGVALALALLLTVGWGIVGLGTENFGSDCLRYFGETGPRADRCYEVNERAQQWFPRLVTFAWGASLSALAPWRRCQVAVIGIEVLCLIAATVLGAHALVVSTP